MWHPFQLAGAHSYVSRSARACGNATASAMGVFSKSVIRKKAGETKGETIYDGGGGTGELACPLLCQSDGREAGARGDCSLQITTSGET